MADTGKQFKVVLLGEGAVGKTSITMRYTSNSFNEHHKVTVQASFQTKRLNVDGQRVTLAVWDTAGQGLLCSSCASQCLNFRFRRSARKQVVEIVAFALACLYFFPHTQISHSLFFVLLCVRMNF